MKFNHVVIELETRGGGDIEVPAAVRLNDVPIEHVTKVVVSDEPHNVTNVTITVLASRVDRERITRIAAEALTPEAYEAEHRHVMNDDGHADGTD